MSDVIMNKQENKIKDIIDNLNRKLLKMFGYYKKDLSIYLYLLTHNLSNVVDKYKKLLDSRLYIISRLKELISSLRIIDNTCSEH